VGVPVRHRLEHLPLGGRDGGRVAKSHPGQEPEPGLFRGLVGWFTEQLDLGHAAE
jgi:hypothetical protein